MDDKKFQIRNSTVDFLVFAKQNLEDSIEVRVLDAVISVGYLVNSRPAAIPEGGSL